MENDSICCPESCPENERVDDIEMTHESSHHGATAIMREFDGDILELGVEELESNNATPMTKAVPNDSIPPALDLSFHSHQSITDGGECQSETVPFTHNILQDRSTGCQQEEVKFSQKIVSTGLSHLSSDSIKEFQLSSNQLLCLKQSSRSNSLEISNDEFELNEKLLSQEDSLLEAKKKLAQLVHRSKSYDRRLSEAAQYYESVGEIPPTDEDEMIRGVIIEEDSSTDDESDDDDDENDAGSVVLASSRNPDHDRRNSADYRIHSILPTYEVSEEASTSPSNANSCDRPSSLADVDNFQQRAPAGEPSQSSSVHLQTGGEEPSSVTIQSSKKEESTESSSLKQHFTLKTLEGASLLSCGPAYTADGGEQQTGYVYKGLRHNPPEITKRGISRGNYAQLHRKAWLEVSDKYHRYGKNLRLYYKHWEKLGHPTNMFFDWLDSKGEAAGQPLPNLPECPRAVLDSDTVLYITNPEKQERYKFRIVPCDTEKGVCRILDGNDNHLYTGPEGWIFVLRDQELYAAPKVTSVSGKSRQRFHHSSFFGGKAVVFAGILITDKRGRLTSLYPHSGHYRPGEAHMQRMLYYLHHIGVDLSCIRIDMQQIMRVSREKTDLCTPNGGKCVSKENEDPSNTHQSKIKKAKKTASLYMQSGIYVALFLGHKASMIEHGVFHHLHKIKRVEEMCVRLILDQIDNGGVRKHNRRHQVKVETLS